MERKAKHLRGDNGKRTVSIYVFDSTLDELGKRADKMNISRNELISDILDKAISDTEN